MNFEIREGTFQDWREIDRINRAVLPENYDEFFYKQMLMSPGTMCFLAVKSDDKQKDNVDEDLDKDLYEDLDEDLDEGIQIKDSREIVGYIITILQLDNQKRLSSHVMSIGILDEYRRKGIGAKLIDATINLIKTKFPVVKSMTLHVRKSNKSAYGFYCKQNFSRAKVIKKYYQDEDAYLMKRSPI